MVPTIVFSHVKATTSESGRIRTADPEVV